MSLLDEATIPEALPLRVLLFDIETAPLHSYHWRVWKENVSPDQLQNRTWMICWAAKWADQKKLRGDTVTGAEARAEDDARVVASLAELIRGADFIVGHNVDRFDLPQLNTRLLDLRLEPLPPVKTVDTLKVAKKAFSFTYNRLSYLADFLGFDGKQHMEMGDWLASTKGDDRALWKMLRYCRQDVRVLEDVWETLRPYAKGLPRMVDAHHEMQHACPSCGASREHVVPAGWHRTNASNFARYRCEKCGRYCRSRSAARGTKLKFHPL